MDDAFRELLDTFDLPKESQQIDRIISSFATVYHRDNPTLFDSPEQVHVLCFALLMLNTDLHSKHVKQHMSLQDFIENTNRAVGPSVPDHILEVLYWNIQDSQFIIAHDGTHTSEPREFNSMKRSTLGRLVPWQRTKLYCQFNSTTPEQVHQEITYLSLLASKCEPIPVYIDKESASQSASPHSAESTVPSTITQSTQRISMESDSLVPPRVSIESSVNTEFDRTGISGTATVEYARKAWFVDGSITFEWHTAVLTIGAKSFQLVDDAVGKTKVENVVAAKTYSDGHVWWVFLPRGVRYAFRGSDALTWLGKGGERDFTQLLTHARHYKVIKPITRQGQKRVWSACTHLLEKAHQLMI